MADDISKKRDVAARLGRLEQSVSELRGEVAQVRTEVIDGVRQLDMRISTEVHEVAGMLRDLRAWLVERDETKQRLARLEEQVTQLLQQRPA